MKKHFYSFLAAALAMGLGTATVKAQDVADYRFTAADTAYVTVPGDSIINDVAFNEDDVQYEDIRLGFSFPWRNTVQTRVSICTNGYLTFDPDNYVPIPSAGNGSILDADLPDIVAFLNVDLTASSVPPSRIQIKRGTQGGQRYFATIFTAFRRYDNETGNGNNGFDADSISVQCWLWESGRISMIYGPSTLDAYGRDAQVGLVGETSGDVLSLRGSWDAPLVTNTNTAVLTLADTAVWRQQGRVFHLRQPQAPAYELALLNLGLPGLGNTRCESPSAQPVSVTVFNRGTDSVTSATISYTVNGGAPVTQQVTFSPALQQLAQQTVTFTGTQAADFSQAGEYCLTVYGSFADSASRNDTLRQCYTFETPFTLPNPNVYTTFDSIIDSIGFMAMVGNRGQLPYNGFGPYDYTSNDDGSMVDVYFSAFADSNDIWLVRHGMVSTTARQPAVAFKLAVGYADFDGSPSSIPSIGDDSLKVRISFDCGQSWRTLRSFTQADLAAGVIDSSSREFLVPLTGVQPNQRFSLAFQFDENGTLPAESYDWLLDNVYFPTGPDVSALAVRGLPSSVDYCLGTAYPITVRYANAGAYPIDTVNISYTLTGLAAPVTQQVIRPLAPGQVDSVTITTPAVIATRGSLQLAVTVTTNGDWRPTNDVRTQAIIVASVAALPATAYTSFANLIAAGFSTGTGSQGAGPGGWVNSGSFGGTNPTTAGLLRSNATNRQDLWLKSGAYAGQATGLTLRFRLAINPGQASTAGGAAIGADDSLKILYRVNCGGWQLGYAYTRAEVQAGRVTNQLTDQVVPMPGVMPGDTFQVAFVATDNGTAPTGDYRWSINSLLIQDVLATRSMAQLGLRLYPNPARGQARLEGLAGPATVTVQDLQGRSLATQRLSAAEPALLLASLPAGTYLVRVQTAAGQAVQRLVIE